MRPVKYPVLWPMGGKRSAIAHGFRPKISPNFPVLHWQWWRLHIRKVFSKGIFFVWLLFYVPLLNVSRLLWLREGDSKQQTLQQSNKKPNSVWYICISPFMPHIMNGIFEFWEPSILRSLQFAWRSQTTFIVLVSVQNIVLDPCQNMYIDIYSFLLF